MRRGLLALPLLLTPVTAWAGQSFPQPLPVGTTAGTIASGLDNRFNWVTPASTSSADFATAVATGLPIKLTAGTWTYSGGSLSVAQAITFEPGAQLACGASNLALNGAIVAPATQIFASGCTPTLFSNTSLNGAMLEWWGGKGDYAGGGTGTGTDNAPALTALLASGAAGAALQAGTYRLGSNVTSARTNFALYGISRDVSKIVQDDASGTADAIFFHGASGGLSFHDVGYSRIQAATGTCGWAYPYVGGTGYVVGDTVTLTGGTETSNCVLTVATVTAGAITGVTITTPGVYTKAPTNPVAQGATSGVGTGATFRVTMAGPSLIHLEDSFFVQIERNSIGGANSWNGITLDSNAAIANKFYIRGNQIFSNENDGVFAYGTSANRIGDVTVEGTNYIQGSGRAGVEFYQNVGGGFVSFNTIYNNAYGVIADVGTLATGSINDLKVRDNDIDTDAQGSYWRGVSAAHFQDNWHSSGGPWICELCTNVLATSNHYEGASSGVNLLGSQAINISDSLFTGMAAPVKLGMSGVSVDKYIMAVGLSYTFGNGPVITVTGASNPGPVTLGVQTDNSGASIVSGSINNVIFLGNDPSNNVTSPSSIALGQSNQIFAADSFSEGFGNSTNCYATVAEGQTNTCNGGSYVRVTGLYADNNSVNNTDAWGAGRFGATGDSEFGRNILMATTNSTSVKELTVNLGTASASTIITMPNTSNYQILRATVQGRDETATGTVACVLGAGGAGFIRDASASTVAALTGNPVFTCGASRGTGAGITVPTLFADTTFGGFSVQVTPPNTDAWRWTAYVEYQRQQQ